MSRIVYLLIIINIQQFLTLPLHHNEKTTVLNFKINQSNHPQLITANNNDNEKLAPIVVPLLQAHQVTIIDPKLSSPRKKKGPNYPIALPITHQLLVPTKLHVIPIHTNVHSTIHTRIINDNVNLPIVTHHTISHSTNDTHQTQLIPILIPIHHTHLVPLHDLTVIPLHRPVHNVGMQLSRYRVSMEKKENEEEEPMNRVRSFYGGYGNGLFFGGHGAGHGFYAYG